MTSDRPVSYTFRCSRGHWIRSSDPDFADDEELKPCPVMPPCDGTVGDGWLDIWQVNILTARITELERDLARWEAQFDSLRPSGHWVVLGSRTMSRPIEVYDWMATAREAPNV